ncbi:MAG: methyltransferase domain-containing protein [Bdellovibrionales bacterium]|nr:methyltransferase domain-containing protein [Bdellovibrionales bacterium]
MDIEKINQAYDSKYWWYDLRGLFILTFAYNSTLWRQISHFSKHMGPVHLEAACGSGTLLDYFLKWRRWKKASPIQVYAFDYADSMLAGALKRFRNNPNVFIEKADVCQLPYPSDFFDSISVANALHSFPNIRGSLKELLRVLKPGGALAGNLLLYPKGKGVLARLSFRINEWGMKKGILHTPYQSDEFKVLVEEAGFQTLQWQRHGNSLDFVLCKPVDDR